MDFYRVINLLLTKMAASFLRNCFHFLFLWVCSRCYLHMIFIPFYFRYFGGRGVTLYRSLPRSMSRNVYTSKHADQDQMWDKMLSSLDLPAFVYHCIHEVISTAPLARRNCLSWYSCLRSSLNVRTFYSRSSSSDYVPCRLRNKELCFSSTISFHFSLDKHQGCFQWKY